MGKFAGQRVVVTGGAQGIGRGVVDAFLREGAEVAAIDADEEALGELPQEVRPVLADLRDPEQAEKACRGLEGVRVLVNNAGIGGSWKGILETSVEEWDEVLNLNLRAYWLMAKLLTPGMAPGSAIVNIASTRALMSEPNTEPYAASKGGVVALTHSLAISLAERRIRVNCISPGWIEVSDRKKSSAKRDPGLRPVDHEQHPAGRVGKPEDIAEACLYLSSDAAGFVTGANLVIDGGMTRKMIYAE